MQGAGDIRSQKWLLPPVPAREFRRERLAPIELFGCVLMAAGMLVTQLGGFWRKKAKD